MNRILRIVLIIFLIQISVQELAKAQCGVTADIACYNWWGSPLSGIDFVAPVVLQPNWKVYKKEWFVNDSLTTLFVGAFLPGGYNKVCVKAYATDTLTMDSCMAENCNIFQSTGFNVFPEMNVNVNGLTASITGSYWESLFYWGSPSFTLNFGDTSYSSLLTDTHTYSVPGDYLVTLDVSVYYSFLGWSSYGRTTRKIHVDNGIQNYQVSTPSLTYTNCDSFAVSTISIPPFVQGFGYVDNGYGSIGAGFSNGVPQGYNADVPGQVMFHAQVYDSGYEIDKYVPVLINECGVIPDTIYGKIFDDADFDGIMDSNEVGVPNLSVKVRADFWNLGTQLNYGALTDSLGNYSLLIPHGDLDLVLTLPLGFTTTFPQQSSYSNIYFNSESGHSGYIFGVTPLNTHIKGIVYIDKNNDSLYNNGEKSLKNTTVWAHSNTSGLDYYRVTDVYGNYQFDLPSGNFTIKVSYCNLDSSVSYPDSIIVSTTTGGTFNGKNFGIRSTLVGGNLGVSLSSSINPRPGFSFDIGTRVENTGVDSTYGNVEIHYDTLLTINSVYPAGGAINPNAHKVTWVTGKMLTQDVKYYSINTTVPASTPLGTILHNSSLITILGGYIENDFTNNFANNANVVVGSFDPNDKLVSPSGYGTSGDVHHNQRLHYRINFQNTGTASAINVFVQDDIDVDLDLNTFKMERASHNYNLVTNGRTFTWKFYNINLPDSNSNDSLSHGFIEYSILPVQGLPDATTIENDADIYFDFNSPVVTNTVVNTLQTNITGIELPVTKNELTVYPVPVKDLLMIQRTEKYKLPLQINLTDISGRIVKKVIVSETPKNNRIIIDVKSLSAGVYVMQLVATNDSQSWKIVKE